MPKRELVEGDSAEPRELGQALRELQLRLSELELQNHQLRQSQAALEKLEAARGEWMAAVAHELSQPLSIIAMSTGRLTREHDERRVAQARAVERIRQSVDRLGGMVEDLLEVSRIEAQRVRLQRRPVDLLQLIHGVIERSAGLLGHRKVRISTQGTPRPIRADPARLEQVLAKVLAVAVRAGANDSEIEVVLTRHSGHTEVAVTSKGAGLSSNELGRMFTRFYRPSPAEGGTSGGFGLDPYIAKGLVEAHGGQVSVESTPGGKTTVRFTMPDEPLEGQDRVEGDQHHHQ